MLDKIKKILEAKQHAILKGGICLSNEYIGCSSKLEWQCSNLNHPTWLASFSSVVTLKHWCRQCSFENRQKKNQ